MEHLIKGIKKISKLSQTAYFFCTIIMFVIV